MSYIRLGEAYAAWAAVSFLILFEVRTRECNVPRSWDWQLAINGIGTVGAVIAAIAASLAAYYNRQAVEEAAQQVDQAKLQTQEAKRQADAATRPALFASIDDPTGSLSGYTHTDAMLRLEVTITDYGAGPAILSRVACVPLWATGPAIDDSQVEAIDADRTEMHEMERGVAPAVTSVVIGPGQSRKFSCLQGWTINHPTPVPAEAAKAAGLDRSGHIPLNVETMFNSIWTVVSVEYAGFDQQSYKTRACAKYDGSHIEGGEGVACNYRD